MKILIVIPTYNNENTICGIVEEILHLGYKILVVIDGSNDKTFNKIKDISGINLINLCVNTGKGNALNEAFKWAYKHNYTHLLTIDADGQHDPLEIPKIVKKLKTHQNCIIIGRRNFKNGHVPFLSRLGRILSSFAFYLITHKKVSDTQSGFRIYPLKEMQNINSRKCRYDFEMDLLLKSSIAKIKIIEVDISVSYSESIKKRSHFKVISDSLKIFLNILELSLNKRN